MDLKSYFKKTRGLGVLSTADDQGRVDSAVYASPHVIDDTHVAFIMSNRLSRENVTKNPYAAYLYKQSGFGYNGKRLYLKKEKESDDRRLIEDTCKAAYPGPVCTDRYLKGSFIVFFKVESVLPLVGDGK